MKNLLKLFIPLNSVVCVIFFFICAFASSAEHLDDKRQAIRHLVMDVAQDIKCITCAGSSVRESNSDFALGVRELIEDRLKQGHTKEEILMYFKQKYGSQIVLDPKFDHSTLLLWSAPALLLTYGVLHLLKLTYY